MTIRVDVNRRLNGSWTAKLGGRLDTTNYQIAEEKLKPLMHIPLVRVVLDLSELEYVSSMGLRVIMLLQKAVAANRGKIVLSNLQPPVAKVFEIARALPPEEIFASIEEADRYLDLMQRKLADEV